MREWDGEERRSKQRPPSRIKPGTFTNYDVSYAHYANAIGQDFVRWYASIDPCPRGKQEPGVRTEWAIRCAKRAANPEPGDPPCGDLITRNAK